MERAEGQVPEGTQPTSNQVPPCLSTISFSDPRETKHLPGLFSPKIILPLVLS